MRKCLVPDLTADRSGSGDGEGEAVGQRGLRGGQCCRPERLQSIRRARVIEIEVAESGGVAVGANSALGLKSSSGSKKRLTLQVLTDGPGELEEGNKLKLTGSGSGESW